MIAVIAGFAIGYFMVDSLKDKPLFDKAFEMGSGA